MLRSASVLLASLLLSSVVVAQTTTTVQGPDGRTSTVTTTLGADGVNRIEMRPAPAGSVPGPDGIPQRDTRPATGTAVIRGRVVDAASGTPLRKAVVNVFSPAIRESRGTTTDPDGRYEVTDLPAGEFNVSVSRTGYVTLAYGQSRPNEPGKPLKLGDKQVAEKIDFSLPRGAVISGRVVDEYGEPIADVMVSALRSQFTTSGPRPMNAGRSATTNDIGEFRLFGLPPGQYLVSAMYRSVGIGNISNADSSGYALTYYPGTANPESAQKLSVPTGGTISDVTLMLVPTRTARVSGIVVDGQGRPVRQGAVMLMSRTANVSMTSAGGPIRADGTFTVNGVSPGEYTIRAMTPSQPGAAPETAVATVTVNGLDISDVRLEPLRPITVSGRVVMDAVAARSFNASSVRLSAPLNEPGPMLGPMPMSAPVAVRDDLTFELKASPGPSIVRLTAPLGSWMIKSVMLDGADVTDGLTFRNDDVSGLEVELTNRVPDVSGLVTDGKGDAIMDYIAVAFPQDQERWNAVGTGRSAMSRPDDQGRFRFRGLRPGNYYVVAVDHLQNGEWMDPAFMEAVHTYAARITLNEGDVQTLDLKLVQMR